MVKAQAIAIPSDVFSAIGNDTATIHPKFIYRSAESVQCWIELTKSDEYQYYIHELSQIMSLASSGFLDLIRECQSGVHIGAGDARKEIELVSSIFSSNREFVSILLDSSNNFLEMSLRNYRASTAFKAHSVLADLTQPQELIGARALIEKLAGRPRLFSCFGNTIGNYMGLKIIESINSIMGARDLLIFGVHNKSIVTSGRSYMGYHSESYAKHMMSVLRDAGINPAIGHLEVCVDDSKNHLVDIIEISFRPLEYFDIYVIDSKTRTRRSSRINKIILDTSCKYENYFVIQELENMGLVIENIFQSKELDNTIFICQKNTHECGKLLV